MALHRYFASRNILLAFQKMVVIAGLLLVISPAEASPRDVRREVRRAIRREVRSKRRDEIRDAICWNAEGQMRRGCNRAERKHRNQDKRRRRKDRRRIRRAIW